MKLAAVHSPTIAPNHSSGPVRAFSTSLTGPRSVAATSGGSRRSTLNDGQLRVLALAEQVRDRGREDEEGEQRQHRQISEVAGVDEAVVIDADRRPAWSLPTDVSRGLSFSSTSVPKAARMLASRLRRASGDWGETSLMHGRR